MFYDDIKEATEEIIDAYEKIGDLPIEENAKPLMRKSVISDIITRYYEEWFEDAESELL
jgi:hypothetical protein